MSTWNILCPRCVCEFPPALDSVVREKPSLIILYKTATLTVIPFLSYLIFPYATSHHPTNFFNYPPLDYKIQRSRGLVGFTYFWITQTLKSIWAIMSVHLVFVEWINQRVHYELEQNLGGKKKGGSLRWKVEGSLIKLSFMICSPNYKVPSGKGQTVILVGGSNDHGRRKFQKGRLRKAKTQTRKNWVGN